MRKTALAATLAAAALAAGLSACGDDDDDDQGAAGEAKQIALLLPESKTARYEAHDRPGFEEEVERLCPECEVLYSNAGQDAAKQQSQAEAAITKGADVLVLDAVDAAAAGGMVDRAKQDDIPVLAYDRLISDAEIDWYVSFDNVRQGRLQADSLLDGLGSDPKGMSIVMINGSPTDPSAGDYKEGAHQVLDESGVDIAKEYDTPDWSPDKAQQEMEQAVTAIGNERLAGVYSANDGMAGGAIAALKAAGIEPGSVPVTGGDAEVAALQRILAGEQYSTIYLTIRKQAEVSAQIAVAAARGEEPPQDVLNAEVDNGSGQVPSVLLTPVVVTRDNIADTVIADGFYDPSEICIGKFAKACREAGIG
jgi:D-xylose transport system substrate-binding protein